MTGPMRILPEIMPIILRVRGLGPMVTDSVRRYSAGSLGSAATSTLGSSASSLRHGKPEVEKYCNR